MPNQKSTPSPPPEVEAHRVSTLRTLLEQYWKNLDELQTQEARYGMSPPIYIVNNIDYHKAKIEEFQTELSRLEKPKQALTE